MSMNKHCSDNIHEDIDFSAIMTSVQRDLARSTTVLHSCS